MKNKKTLALAILCSILGGGQAFAATDITTIPYSNAVASGEYNYSDTVEYAGTGSSQAMINIVSNSNDTTLNYTGSIQFKDTAGGSTNNGVLYLTAANGKNLSATIAEGAKVITDGRNSDGVWIAGQGTTLTNNGTITVQKDSGGVAYLHSFGLVLAGSATAVNNGTINVTGGQDVATDINAGVYTGYDVSGYANVNMTNQFVNNGTINADGPLTHGIVSYGVKYDNGATNKGTINVTGTGDGMTIYGTSTHKIFFTNSGQITTTTGAGIRLMQPATARGTIALQDGSDIHTTGTGTDYATAPIGIKAGYTDITSDGTSSIKTDGDFTPGMYMSNSTLNVNSGNLSIATGGIGGGGQNSACGIVAEASDATVQSGATLNIQTTSTSAATALPGGTADGIWLSDNSNFTNNGTLKIETIGWGAEGFEVTAGTINLNGTTNVNTKSQGFLLASDGTLNLGANSNTTTEGEEQGIGVGVNSRVAGAAGSKLTINTTGDGKNGIVINHSSGVVELDGTNNITVNGNTSYGIKAQQAGNQVTLGSNSVNTITTNGTNNRGIAMSGAGSLLNMAAGSQTTINSNSGTGIEVLAGANVTDDGLTKINMLGEGIGVLVDDSSTVTAGATGSLDISNASSNNVTGIKVTGALSTDAAAPTTMNLQGADNVGILAGLTANANIAGDLLINTNNGSAIILDDGTTAVVNVNQAGGREVRLTGDLLGKGTTVGPVMNVKMDTGTSFLTGKVDKGAKEINLDMANAAMWNVTADSNATTITNNSGATINMQHSGNDIYETVTTDDYLGTGGVIRLNTDLNSQTDSDKLVINAATTAANGEIQVYDKSLSTGTEVTGEKHVLVVVDPSGKTTWSGKALDTGGLWDVTPTVERGDAFGMGDTNWYLRKFAKTLNTRAKDILGSFDSAYGTWRSSLTDDTLRKRLGDLRRTQEDDGIWARIKAGKLNNAAYDSSYQMYQVGYDKKTSQDSYAGIAVDHVRSSSALNSGKGEGSMTDLSIYGTSYHKSGAYSDIVLRAGKARNSMNSFGTTPDSLDYNTWTYSASYELGKTYSKDNGWFLEPEVQLTYGYMRGGDYTTDNGAVLRSEGTKSLVGRAGLILGRSVKDSDYYVKANLYREFTGERSLDISTVNNYGYTEAGTFTQGHKDTWFELGLGGNVKLSKKTYMYGDVLKTFGAEVQKTWQVNAGVRWTF